MSGDDVFVTARIINGTALYQFIWEIRTLGSESWTTVRNNTVENPLDILLVPSVTTSFEVRCSVSSGGETISKEILIIVAE